MREYAYTYCINCGKPNESISTDSEVFPSFCSKRCMFSYETDTEIDDEPD